MSIDGGFTMMHHYDKEIKYSNNVETLTNSIERIQEYLRSSDLNPYQAEYTTTSLTSLQSLITSLKAQYDNGNLPQDLYEQFSTLIVKFKQLVFKANSRKSSFISSPVHPKKYIDTQDDADISFMTNKTNKSQASSAFNSPMKKSFSRSSSISKPTITKENVLREPLGNESVDFLRFATPGLNQQLQGIFKSVDVRDLKGLQELSRSSDVFVD